MWPIKINKKLIYIVFTLLWTKRFNELIFWVTESSLNVRRFSLWYKACKCHIYDNVCSSFTVISTSLCGLHKIFIYLTEWVIIWCLKVDFRFLCLERECSRFWNLVLKKTFLANIADKNFKMVLIETNFPNKSKKRMNLH